MTHWQIAACIAAAWLIASLVVGWTVGSMIKRRIGRWLCSTHHA